MSTKNTESDIKIIGREELKRRLRALTERDHEAVAVLAARCALRVLPFAAENGAFSSWRENTCEHVQSIFIACTLGLEYRLIGDNKNLAAAVDAAARAAYDIAYELLTA
ncbi:hypothetical protein [Nitrosomonas sp.]|uniref:hypothetical protein n=1 Tax=Nitrosomonas sp. TaxID=42353 RepID=UPI0020840979|nr:hypothetical protein [Nitrosomonas sp.]GJL76285.1 MAG: hypothetical protein NMNS02_23910 [Nitrosomonas sp.]